MTEITKSNFDEILPFLEKSIEKSSFIAFDTEFTGLDLGKSNENNLFDTLPERYGKLRCRTTSFIPCQIGLSIFSRSVYENSYSVEAYVFYVRPCMAGSTDRRFVCQASAMDFLSRYNFDFRKFMQEGIPYLNENEEMQVRKELKDGSISAPHEKLLDTRYQMELTNNINRRFSETLIKSKATNEETKLLFPINEMSHVYFQLNEVRRKFPSLWAYVENDMMAIKMVSPEERKKLEESIVDDQEEVVDYFLGFTKVFRLLKKYQKPIVGHNCLVDLMLFFHNFHQTLPDSYEKFKKELHDVFPVIYDTKQIWMNLRRIYDFKKLSPHSGLPVMYGTLKSPPDFLSTMFSPDILPTNCRKYVAGDFVHDSGFDSFMTGYVFIKLCHIIAVKNISVPALIRPQTFKQHILAVSPFVNEVNFPFFSLRYMKLGGEDPKDLALSFLYISPKNSFRTMDQAELRRRFGRYYGVEFKLVKLRTAAVAAVKDFHICNRILKEFKEDPDITVEEYNEYGHSTYTSTTLWLTAVASGCLFAAWIWKIC